MNRCISIASALVFFHLGVASFAQGDQQQKRSSGDFGVQALASSVDLDPESEVFDRLVERIRHPKPIPAEPVIEQQHRPVAHFRRPGSTEIPHVTFSRAKRDTPQFQSRTGLLGSTGGVAPQFDGTTSSLVLLSREERIGIQLAPFTADPLPTCTKSHTTKKKNSRMKGRLVYEADPLIDLLVLPERAPSQKDFVSFSFPELFGESVSVQYFSTKPGDVVSSQLAENGIECVPARLIVTKEEIFVHTGERALRYYEFDSETRGNKKVKKRLKQREGKPVVKDGKLHPMVASRLDDFLKEG